jgi:hypothetical protein
MSKSNLLSQASAWGFVCESDAKGNWQIFPCQKTERWQLQQLDDRWLLLVGGVQQVNLYPPEAIAFLNRRRSSSTI